MYDSTEQSEEQKHYYEELERKQKEHLKRVSDWLDKATGNNYLSNNFVFKKPWKPCMHEQCSSCHGTGIKFDGSMCVHTLYCDCPKCSPTFMTNSNTKTA